MKQFHHIGLPTDESHPGEYFVEDTKVWVTDPRNHPYKVEYLRFEPDSPVTGPVREQPHVAYRVADLEEAGRGLKLLLGPFDAGPRIVVFYQTPDGAVVEFLKDKET